MDAIGLCSQRLATAPATGAHNFTTTRSGFARKETMATSAYKVGRLESPLHFVLEYLIGAAPDHWKDFRKAATKDHSSTSGLIRGGQLWKSVL